MFGEKTKEATTVPSIPASGVRCVNVQRPVDNDTVGCRDEEERRCLVDNPHICTAFDFQPTNHKFAVSTESR